MPSSEWLELKKRESIEDREKDLKDERDRLRVTASYILVCLSNASSFGHIICCAVISGPDNKMSPSFVSFQSCQPTEKGHGALW